MAMAMPATWQEAFETHPIAKVKALELELRSSTLRDKERLRLLVGNNYRDLLATAGHIVDLNDQAHEVEQSLTQLSQDCQAPDFFLAKTAQGDSEADVRTTTIARVQFAVALLRQTSKCAKDRSVSLGSKTLVLARLLINRLNEDKCPQETTGFLSRRLRESRRRLLGAIDQLLVEPTTSLSRLVEAAVAYCLATSSSALEAVSHMHDLRAQRLASSSDQADNKAALRDLVQRCQYIIVTRDATKALAGRRVIGMLTAIQIRPILQDPELQSLQTLQLDTLGVFLPLDIAQFTPYFKRSQPSPAQIDELLRQWVAKRGDVLVQQIASVIDSKSLPRVLAARSDILAALLPATFSAHIHRTLLPNVQACFAHRIEVLLTSQANELTELDLSAALITRDNAAHNFWQEASSYRAQGMSDKRQIQTTRNLHLGLDTNTQATLKKLGHWLRKVKQTRLELEKLKKQRWQDKIEESDDDDASDFGESDRVQGLAERIGQTEPLRFERVFTDQVAESARIFVSAIASKAKRVLEENESEGSVSECVAILRLSREARYALQSVASQEIIASLDTASNDMESYMAQQSAAVILKQVIIGLDSTAKEGFTTDDLPSPHIIKLLQIACNVMLQEGGIDCWSPSATGLLRRELLRGILEADTKDKIVKTTFDEYYIKAALGLRTDEEVEGVARKASLYWLRTKSLFGMLDSA